MEEFISAAMTETRQATPAPGTKRYPWEAPGLRADVTRLYNLRLPEPYLLKLKYIAEHTSHSMQKFCLDLLLPAIDARIDKLIRLAPPARRHRPVP